MKHASVGIVLLGLLLGQSGFAAGGLGDKFNCTAFRAPDACGRVMAAATKGYDDLKKQKSELKLQQQLTEWERDDQLKTRCGTDMPAKDCIDLMNNKILLQKDYETKLLKFSKDIGDINTQLREKEKIEIDRLSNQKVAQEEMKNLQRDLNDSFSTFGDDLNSLMIEGAINRQKYEDFERGMDRTRLSVYLREKMKDMLSNKDGIMCSVVSKCGAGGKFEVTEEQMNGLFRNQNIKTKASEGSGSGAGIKEHRTDGFGAK